MLRCADRAAAFSMLAALVVASMGCELIAGITDRHVYEGEGGHGASGASTSGSGAGVTSASSASGGGPSSSSNGGGQGSTSPSASSSSGSASTGGGSASSSAGSGTGGGGGTTGSGAGGQATGPVWPDSRTIYCTNGVAQVTPCPPSSDPLFGQDGNYREHEPTYDTSVAGVAVDSVTGLMWDRQVITSHNAGGLDTACSALSDGGFHDWRAPDMLELLSLVDFGKTLPAIDAVTFANAQRFLWSNEVDVEDGTKQWGIDFTTGNASPTTKTQLDAVMCVRGALPAPGLVSAGAEMLADPRTGLTWETNTPMSTYIDWADALFTCENLSLGGHDDWRLPSAKELLTLMRRDETTAPYVDPAIQGETTLDQYWSSSPLVGDPASGHIVDFYSGYVTQGGLSNNYNVRCVRDSD